MPIISYGPNKLATLISAISMYVVTLNINFYIPIVTYY